MKQASNPATKSSKLLYWGAGAALWAVAGVMGLASYEPDKSPNLTASNEADRAFAERAFANARDAMKDPTSVKFKDVTASAKANCMIGKLLAKNSFGAYNGYQEFVWLNGRTLIDPGAVKNDIITDNIDDVIDFSKARVECRSAFPTGNGNWPLNIPSA